MTSTKLRGSECNLRNFIKSLSNPSPLEKKEISKYKKIIHFASIIKPSSETSSKKFSFSKSSVTDAILFGLQILEILI